MNDLELDHPVIAELKKRVGGTFADKVTDDHIVSEFIFMPPLERAKILADIDKAVGSDDVNEVTPGWATRERQAISVRNRMRELDFSMRKANR